MKIFEKINPKKTLSLLLFYIAMALSTVYFDLFQAIENSPEDCPACENTELVLQQNHLPTDLQKELVVDHCFPEKVASLKAQTQDPFKTRLFHENRKIARQLKEVEKKPLFVYYLSHQQIALIISHQKMEEEQRPLA